MMIRIITFLKIKKTTGDQRPSELGIRRFGKIRLYTICCGAMLVLGFVGLPVLAQNYVEPTKLANRLFPTNSTSTYANGSSVALNGDVLVVGDPAAGAAYVFNRNAGGADNWGQVKTLFPDSPPRAGFGTAIACDGATIVVGSPNENAAYVFSGGGSSWSRNDKIEMYYQNSFGGAVAVSGDFVVVGAPHGYTVSGAGYEGDAGAAYLFYRNAPSPNDRVGGQGNGWGVVGNAPNAEGNLFGGGVTLYNASGNHFGTSVAVNGDYVAVGAPEAEPGANPNWGLVTVFYIKNLNGTNIWEFAYPMDPAVYKIPGGKYGQSLALHGNRLLVGQPNANAIYIFDLKPVPFGERVPLKKKIISPESIGGFKFGGAVAMTDNKIYVGDSGYRRVYEFDAAGSLLKKYDMGSCDDSVPKDFGKSIAASSDMAVIGAPPTYSSDTNRVPVWLTKGVSQDFVDRWKTLTGGRFLQPTNWTSGIVPDPCSFVLFSNQNPATVSVNCTDFSQPVVVRDIEVNSGNWVLTMGPGSILTTSNTITVAANASAKFNDGHLNAPEINLKSGSLLSAIQCQVQTPLLDLGDGSSLFLSGGFVTVTNLVFSGNVTMGWYDGGIKVEGDLDIPNSATLNIQLLAAQQGSTTPLFNVNSNRYFLPGGRLNFIPVDGYVPQPGHRFRLVQFNPRTDNVDTVYKLFGFQNYDPNIPGYPNLIWGLAFRQEGGLSDGAQFIEILVMRKPRHFVPDAALAPSGKTGLVFLTHGTMSKIEGLNESQFGQMAVEIQTFLQFHGNSGWDVVTFDWREYSTGVEFNLYDWANSKFTYNAATSAQIGIGLAESLKHWMDYSGFHYTKMHLLSHSSGSWLINRMSELTTESSANQVTFFDAFINPSQSFFALFGDRFKATLGGSSDGNDFVEHYVDRSWVPPGTGDILPNAVNFDITSATIPSPPYNDVNGVPVIAQHAWPYVWYLETLRYANASVPSFAGVTCGGFLLSPEFLESTQNDPSWTFMRDYKARLRTMKGQDIRITTISGCENAPLTSTLETYPNQFQNVSVAPVGTYSSTAGGGVAMTTGLAAAAGPLPHGNGGPTPQDGPPPSGAQWAAITNSILLPHSALEFSFDYQFGGNSNGILSIIVDGLLKGVLDQSFVGTNHLSTDGILLNPELGSGPHIIVFLLESSTSDSSSVSLSNLQFGYDLRSLIVNQKVLTNGSVQLTLQGIPSRTYTIERASELANLWTNIGVTVTGTNGVGLFTDSNAPAAHLFYRAYAAAPSISTTTQYQTNFVGNSLTLSVNVQGTPTLFYQWFQNGVIIVGATNSTFSFLSLTTNASGIYSMIVSNSHGMVESQIANLTVLVPPTITAQPMSWVKVIGESIGLNVTASGTPPLTYRWRKNGLPLADGGGVSGSGTPALAITNLQIGNQASYDIEVSSAGGTAVSQIAQLIVMPLSQTDVITGLTATATSELTAYGRVAANAVNGIYFDNSFWESVGYDQGFGRDAAPAITFDLKKPYPLDNFVIWNGHEPGRAIKRLSADVSMDGTNFISLGEFSLAVTTGGLMSETNILGGVSTRFVRFTILEGWNGVDYPTEDPNPASALVAIDEVEFYLIKTNQNAPVIIVHPPNQILQPGQPLFFGTAASGTDPLLYQWRRGGIPILDGTNVSGAKTPTLVITNAQVSDLGNYEVVVTNYFGSVTSHVAKLSLPLPVDSLLVTGVTVTATSQLPSNFNRPPINMVNNAVYPGGFWESIGVNQGFGEDRAPVITFDLGKVQFLEKLVFLNGPEYPASVKRMRAEVSTDGQSFLPAGEINLAIGSSPPTPQTNLFGIETRYVRFHILENWDGQVFPVIGPRTANSFAEIDEVFFYAYAVPSGPPLITAQPANLIRIVGATADFTVTVLGSEPLAYQWKRNGTNLAQGGNLSGTTSATLTLTNVQFSDAAEYQAIVTNAFGATNSIVARLTVIPAAGVLLVRPSLVGSNMTFHLLGMPGTTWEIQRAPALVGPWTGIGTVSIGSDADTFFSDSNPLKPASFYRAVEAQLIAPSISVQPLNITNLVGSLASFGATASGTMPIAYQWRFLGTNIVAATNALLQITNVQFSHAGGYDVVVTNMAGTTNSTVASLTVVGPPLITAQPQSRTNLAGTTANLNVTVTGTAPLSYHWLKGESGLFDGGNVSGATTPMLTLTNVQSTDVAAYKLVITNSYGSVTSVVATITVLSNLNSVLVTGVTATASSELAAFGRIAANAVNGIYYDGAFWESLGVNQGFGEDRNPAITFDLLTVRSLDKFVIWNGHEPDASVKRMTVNVSVDGTNFNSLGELILTNISPASQTNALNGVSARYVRFNILENGAGQIFPAVGAATAWSLVAIDEVEFHEYKGN